MKITFDYKLCSNSKFHYTMITAHLLHVM